MKWLIDRERRKIIHVGVTKHNNVFWLRNQLRAAFPGECPYRFLIRDNDAVFSGVFDRTIKNDFGLLIKKTAKRQPWQNGVVERPQVDLTKRLQFGVQNATEAQRKSFSAQLGS